MLYSTYILQLRNQVGDTRRRKHVKWTADGSTDIFQMPDDTYPVLDQSSTYDVKVDGSVKTETTDYTLDKETGTLVMVSTPASDAAITIDCSAVRLTNASWLQIINDVIQSLGDDFWKEIIDESLTTTANMLSIAMITNIIAVYDFMHRTSTSNNWQLVEEFTNWRYSRDENKIYLGDRTAFTITGDLLHVRGLKTYVLGTATTATVDVQDKYLTIIEFGSIARYWRYRYKDVVELVSKFSQESSRTPLQELIMLADRFDRLYENEKGKLKPQKPARVIPQFKEGGGRP